jgi:hypothetical protein
MMTLSHFSVRLGALAAVSALSATLVFVAPQAHAASNGSYYKIELAQYNEDEEPWHQKKQKPLHWPLPLQQVMAS